MKDFKLTNNYKGDAIQIEETVRRY